MKQKYSACPCFECLCKGLCINKKELSELSHCSLLSDFIWEDDDIKTLDEAMKRLKTTKQILKNIEDKNLRSYVNAITWVVL